MSPREPKTAISLTVERLRAIVLDLPEGELIGSEETLIARLGASRSTVRQVARLLEREGLLRVRRGINGGYFSARPNAGTIEATVSAYLETLDMDVADVTVLASALWIEAVRKAASADRVLARQMAERLRPLIHGLSAIAPFSAVRDLELASQAEVFALANSPYIKLIFDINVVFSRRRFPPQPETDNESPEHIVFVETWKQGKLLELGAIAMGDRELAVMAARYTRSIWHKRVWRRFASPEQ